MFKKRPVTIVTRSGVIGVLLASMGLSGAATSSTVEALVQEGIARTEANAQDQQRIEQIAEQTDKIVSEYKTEVKVVDGLLVYNGLLQKQINNQLDEMDALEESIDNVSLIERQIIPLMTRMLDSLEEFIALDTPFLQEERATRLENLRTMMERSDVTAAEKFRRVLEAFQIENDYGRTIEAYKGSVDIDGRQQEVDFLRVGRVALLYQSVGGQYTAAWDNDSRSYVPLPPEIYKQQVERGLRIARKQVAPDMLIVPVPTAKEAGQ